MEESLFVGFLVYWRFCLISTLMHQYPILSNDPFLTSWTTCRDLRDFESSRDWLDGLRASSVLYLYGLITRLRGIADMSL